MNHKDGLLFTAFFALVLAVVLAQFLRLQTGIEDRDQRMAELISERSAQFEHIRELNAAIEGLMHDGAMEIFLGTGCSVTFPVSGGVDVTGCRPAKSKARQE